MKTNQQKSTSENKRALLTDRPCGERGSNLKPNRTRLTRFDVKVDPDPIRNEVDITYVVEEKSSDQIQLQPSLFIITRKDVHTNFRKFNFK